MVTTTAIRVSSHTSKRINDQIERETDIRIDFYSRYPEKIDQRLHELDREWDIERMLETGSSTLTLTGLIMSKVASRKWLLLSLGVQGFFLQHALQGWCPPLPVLRRLGFRTPDEINQERYVLIELRESLHKGQGPNRRSADPQTSGSQA